MDISNDLKEIIKGEISSDELTRKKFSRDTSIFEIFPEVVVSPKDTADIQALVEYVNKNKKKNTNLSLTARSAGTDMSGGPLTDSIVVDFTKYFNHIHTITKDYAIVEPGVYFRDFEKELLEKNEFYPPYPASKQLCALGGIVNNNSGGEKTLQYGKTNKYILGLRTILSDGNEYYVEKITVKEAEKKAKQKNFEGQVYKKILNLLSKNQDIIKPTRPNVSKNSSGYNIWDAYDGEHLDLTQLICGAQGTLGFVTEAKLRLVPKPKHSKLYVVFLKSLHELPAFVQEVLALKPSSVEITDDHTFRIYLRYAREMAELLGSSGGILETMKLFMPETLLILRHGMPKLIALVEFEGNETRDLNHEIRQVGEIVKRHKLIGHPCRTKMETEKYWKLRRDTFKLLREKITDRHSTPFVDDIIVRPELLPEFWPKLTSILDRSGIFYTISGHLGDGNLHIIPLMDLRKECEREKIYPTTDAVYNLTLQYKGSLSAEHNDGLIRSPYLKQQFGEEIYKIFEEVKHIFDPHNIFNPHKKIGVTKEYAMERMIKS